MRRFAKDTHVAIEKSRFEIEQLLRSWSCEGVAWANDWIKDETVLQFKLPRLGPDKKSAVVYVAQFKISVETRESIAARCTGSRGLAQAKFDEAMSRRGRREHRVLYLWLKAAFEAVEEGIVEPEALFMPFFVCRDGVTVYEAARPKLAELMSVPSSRLLAEVAGGKP